MRWHVEKGDVLVWTPSNANSTVYSDIGLNGKYNAKFSTSLIENRKKITEETSKFYLDIRSFQPKSKMDPFECHTFEEAIDHEIGFTIIQP